MTSKISCVKLIRENIRHRMWLTALCAVAFLLMMPVYSILYLNSVNGPGYEQDPDQLSFFLDYLPTLFNCSRLALFAGVFAILVLLCALTGFWHIHSREKLDLYHSLPVRRGKLYAVSWLSGLIMLYVPYLICAALTAAVVAASGLVPVTGHVAVLCLRAVLGGIAAVFILYNACVFAIVLAGRTVTALLACLAVSVYPLIALYSIFMLQGDFFHSFYNTGQTLTERLALHLSPAGLFIFILQESSTGSFFTLTATAIVIGAVLMTASFLLYRIYPSEAAGNALAFPRSAPVLKVLIVIPCSIFASMIIMDFMRVPNGILTILLSVLAAVLLCAVIEFIFHMDLRKLFRGWKSSLTAIAGVVAVLCVFQFDLTGYDSYLPDEGELKTVSIYPDSFSYYFSYPGYDDRTKAETESYVPADQTDAAYALAQSGINNLENGITPDSIYESASNHTDGEYMTAVFHYKLNSGRTVSRQYAIRRDEVKKTMTGFLADEEYRRRLFPVTQIDKSRTNDITVTDLYGTEELLELEPDQREALLNAYETDLMNADPDTLVNETEVAQLNIYLPDPDDVSTAETSDRRTSRASSSTTGYSGYLMGGLYIYPGFSNTLDLLGSYGYTLSEDIDPAELISLRMTVYPDSVSGESFEKIQAGLSRTASVESIEEYSGETISVEVTSEEDIALILDNISQKHFGMLDDYNTSGGYVDISYKNGEFGYISLG